MHNFSTGPIEKRKRKEKNVLKALRQNKSRSCQDMM